MTRLRLLLAVVTAVVLAVLISGPGSAGTAPASGASAAKVSGLDREIRDGRINESSGLAASIAHPGVLWTLNDSGHPPVIYAVGTDGRTAATVTLTGEYNRDWEAMTALRMPPRTGRAMLAVGDIGDNQAHHPSVRIAIVPEPALKTQKVKPTRVFRVNYPDGARDAEALLADPRTGRLYIVTKALFTSNIYAVPESVWPGRRTGFTEGDELEKVASTGADLITDGTFLPSGHMLLRNYGDLYLLPPPEQADGGRLSAIAAVGLPDQEQGETLTTDDGGQSVLIGSEGDRSPVLRLARSDLGDVGDELDDEKPSGAGASTGQSGAAGDPAGPGVAAGDPAAGDPAAGAGAAEPDASFPGTTWLLGLGMVVAAGILLVLGTSTFLRRH